jgi:phosphatidylethanolamine-binding protein (PEBP) family uncharacterized protein
MPSGDTALYVSLNSCRHAGQVSLPRTCSARLSTAGLCAVLLSSADAAAPFTVQLANDAALACGSGKTPTLSFGTPPTGTKSLAVIFWDQQGRTLTGRWTVYDLPLGTRGLASVAATSAQVSGARVAVNEAGKLGYTAPCANGRHDLYVDFYALDAASLNLPAGAPLQTVHAAIKRHKLLEAKAHVVVTIQ